MKNIRAYFDLTCAMTIVGSSIIVGKIVTERFPVFLASELRFAVASVVLIPILVRYRKQIVMTKKLAISLFLQSFTGIFLFSIFLLYGLRFTSPTDAGIITGSTPVVLCVLAAVFLRERISIAKAAAIAVTAAGIILLHLPGLAPHGELHRMLAGNLLVFGAVIGESLFTIFGKRRDVDLPPIITAAFVSVIGLALFALPAAYEAASFDFSAVRADGWIAIIYSGIVVTVVAFFFWFRGIARVLGSTAAVFTGAMPVSAVVLSAAILGEDVGLSHLAGIVCVCAGIILIARNGKKDGERTVPKKSMLHAGPGKYRR
jgi:drug/metabolite transporter (DMT)-like permease